MRKIEDFLRLNAHDAPDRVAVLTPDEALTYGELHRRVEARVAHWTAQAGRVVVLRSCATVDFLVDYFAIHVAGAVAVPIAKDATDEELGQTERRLAGLEIPSGVADILFTTGTTGLSKAVMIGHEALLANADNLVTAQGYSRELVFVICGPLHHLGSLSKIGPVMQCGGTLYLLDGLKNLPAFFAAMGYSGRKTATFLVPTAIHMLLTLGRRQLEALSPNIDFIETGASPMPLDDMQALCQLLPHSRLYNTYASTETGIVATYNYNGGPCGAGCVGRAMRHSHVTVTTEGRVVCGGATVMRGYADDAALTAEVLKEGCVLTADLGRLDDEGRLWLEGRMDDLINTGGLKVAPLEVENVALAMEGVVDCLCIAAAHPLMGVVPKLLVVCPEGQTLDARGLARQLRQRLDSYKVPVLFEQVDHIAKTFNGKPDRKYYRHSTAQNLAE